jgi:phospholipid/cholesterol/gamma-HCH transport system substrate-binding protein
MKKMANEFKVGVIALLTILAFIWLYSFLKGKDILTSTAHYYCVYDRINGLAESSPVEVNGHKVGVVRSIKFIDPVSGRLLVVLAIDKEFRLPRNTVAEITTATLIAGMKVQLVYGKGPGFYSSGDTIPSHLAESLISRVEDELVPVRDKMMHLISELDSVVGSVNEIMDPKFRKNLSSGVASLSNTAKSIDEAELKTTFENIKKFTNMLSENSEKISGTLTNLQSVSDTLAAADIYNSVNNLKSSLEKATSLLENLNKGKGTAGKLMTNDSLYENMSGTLNSLDQLLQDMKANPKRYVHFSIFGRKNIPAK